MHFNGLQTTPPLIMSYKTPLIRLIALTAVLMVFNACEQRSETSNTQAEVLEFKASAYPYFHVFWNPVRERATDQDLAISIQKEDASHQFICRSAEDTLKPIILHISKGAIHIGNDMGAELEDVSLEQLEANMNEYAANVEQAGVRLHVRNNVSGERVEEVLWVLARAGITELVAPTTEPDPGVDGGPLLEDDPSSP